MSVISWLNLQEISQGGFQGKGGVPIQDASAFRSGEKVQWGPVLLDRSN